MIRSIIAGLFGFTCYAAQAFAAVPANVAGAGRGQESGQGMVLRGDQEAPLVLYIVPWQDPKPVPAPEAPQVPLLPKVFDHQRSLLDDPVNRPLFPKGSSGM